MTQTITTLVELQQFLATIPNGTGADVLPQDIEAGNFDTMHLEYPDGTTLDIDYTGEVAEGYDGEWLDAGYNRNKKYDQ